jgi:hypothetical protein
MEQLPHCAAALSRYRRLLVLCWAAAALPLAGGCGRQETISVALTQPAPTRPLKAALEQVADAEKALQMAGFDQAWVYRWQGGLLEGHVLDTAYEDGRVAIDTEEKARQAHNIVVAEAANGDGKAPFDPALASGMIVIAIRPKKDDSADRECIWAVSVRLEQAGKTAELGTRAVSARLPDFTATVKANQLCELTLADGSKRNLFELRLRSDSASK